MYHLYLIILCQLWITCSVCQIGYFDTPQLQNLLASIYSTKFEVTNGSNAIPPINRYLEPSSLPYVFHWEPVTNGTVSVIVVGWDLGIFSTYWKVASRIANNGYVKWMPTFDMMAQRPAPAYHFIVYPDDNMADFSMSDIQTIYLLSRPSNPNISSEVFSNDNDSYVWRFMMYDGQPPYAVDIIQGAASTVAAWQKIYRTVVSNICSLTMISILSNPIVQECTYTVDPSLTEAADYTFKARDASYGTTMYGPVPLGRISTDEITSTSPTQTFLSSATSSIFSTSTASNSNQIPTPSQTSLVERPRTDSEIQSASTRSTPLNPKDIAGQSQFSPSSSTANALAQYLFSSLETLPVSLTSSSQILSTTVLKSSRANLLPTSLDTPQIIVSSIKLLMGIANSENLNNSRVPFFSGSIEKYPLQTSGAFANVLPGTTEKNPVSNNELQTVIPSTVVELDRASSTSDRASSTEAVITKNPDFVTVTRFEILISSATITQTFSQNTSDESSTASLARNSSYSSSEPYSTTVLAFVFLISLAMILMFILLVASFKHRHRPSQTNLHYMILPSLAESITRSSRQTGHDNDSGENEMQVNFSMTGTTIPPPPYVGPPAAELRAEPRPQSLYEAAPPVIRWELGPNSVQGSTGPWRMSGVEGSIAPSEQILTTTTTTTTVSNRPARWRQEKSKEE